MAHTGISATVHNHDNPYTEIDEEGNITWKTYSPDPKAERQALEAIALLQRARIDKEQLDVIPEDIPNAPKKSGIRSHLETGVYPMRMLLRSE